MTKREGPSRDAVRRALEEAIRDAGGDAQEDAPGDARLWRRAFIVALLIIFALVAVYGPRNKPEESGVTRYERP